MPSYRDRLLVTRSPRNLFFYILNTCLAQFSRDNSNCTILLIPIVLLPYLYLYRVVPSPKLKIKDNVSFKCITSFVKIKMLRP